MKTRAFHIMFILTTALAISCIKASPSAPAKVNAGSDSNSTSQADEFAANRLPLHSPLVQPKIVVIKSKRRLMLYSGSKLVRLYRVGLGLSPIEDKTKEGDRRTPEGEFYIFTKNDKSAFYLSLGLSYPKF